MNRRFKKNNLDDFYQSGEYHVICMNSHSDEKTFELEYSVMSLVIIDVLNRLEMNPVNTNVVEIGCGSGGILLALKEWGAKRVKGYDIDDKRLDFGRERVQELIFADAMSKTFSMDEDFDDRGQNIVTIEQRSRTFV